MTDAQIVRWGRVVAGTAVVLPVLGWAWTALQGRPELLMGVWSIHNGLAGLGLGTLVWVMLPKQPRNAVVWAYAWSAIFGAVFTVALPVGIFLSPGQVDGLVFGQFSPSEVPYPAGLAFQLMSVAWIQLFVMLTVGLQRFPDGRLLTPRWRWLERISLALIAAASIAGATLFRPSSTVPIDTYDTPLGSFVDASIGFTMLLALASGIGLAVRYRRSSAEVRRQIRWIALGGVALGLSFAVSAALSGTVSGGGEGLVGGISLVAEAILIAAFWVAITKYRLYDVDVVISRAVTYGALALFIAGVYSLVVVGIGSLTNQSDEPNLWLSIGATALIAVLFEPIYSRIRGFANRLVYGERATPYSVLSQLSGRLASTEGDALSELAALASAGTGADRATVWVRVGSRLVGAATWPEQDLDAASELPEFGLPALDAELVVPVIDGEEIVGAIGINKQRGEPANDQDRRLLEEVAGSATLLLRNQRLNAELAERAEQLRASRKRLVAAHDAERHRLERDLHDGAQQQVVALKVKLGLARAVAEREGAEAVADMVASLSDDSQEVVDAMRAVARGIYPPLLQAEGLAAALGAIRRTAVVPVRLNVDGIGRYSQALEETVYFCVLGMVDTAIEGGAGQISIQVGEHDDDLEIALGHDGTVGSAGLEGIADRVDASGGVITASEGTSVPTLIRLPQGMKESV